MISHTENAQWESAVRRVVIILSTLAALAPPIIYCSLALNAQRASIYAEVEINAHLITELINKNPEYWKYEQSRFVSILSQRLRKGNYLEYRQLFDNELKLIAEHNDVLEPPLLSDQAMVFDAGSPVGFVKISRSLRGIIYNALLISLLSIFFGLCVFFALRIFPLRVLRSAFAALHAEKEQATVTLNSIGDAVITTDVQLRVQSLNSAAVQITGRDPVETTGRPVSEIIDVFDQGTREHTDISFEKCLNSNESCILKQAVSLVRQGDGRAFQVEITVAPLHDEKRGMLGLVIVLHDTTERRLLAERLQEKLTELEVIVEYAGVGIGFVRQGIVQEVNEECARILGYPAEEIIGKNASYVISPNMEYSQFYEQAHNRFLQGKTLDIEFQTSRSDGEDIWIRLIGHGVDSNQPKEKGSVWIVLDVTKRKEYQEELQMAKARAEEASTFKSEFLAQMSHEIRTPMNAILGMNHLVLDTDLTAKQRDYLTIVQTSAEALLTLLNDILDFSKIEAGLMTLEEMPFDLSATFSSVGNILRMKAQEKGLTLRFEHTGDVHTSLIGDELRLSQILVNLLANAIKFTEKGGVVVHCEMLSETADEVVLQFRVIDTGGGIPEIALIQIFQSFSQASSSIARMHGGSGLGLSICKKLTSLLGGDIWVESTVGQGSTFFFTARFGKGVVRPIASSSSPSSGKAAILPEEHSPSLNILLVEDNQFNQDLAKIILERENHTVEVAKNGCEPVHKIENTPY